MEACSDRYHTSDNFSRVFKCQYLSTDLRTLLLMHDYRLMRAVNVSETRLPFFLIYQSICIRESIDASSRFSAVRRPTSVLRGMPLSNTSTTKLDNFDGNRRSARRRRLKLADESVGNSLPTFHQVC